jgi:hypothetical protein
MSGIFNMLHKSSRNQSQNERDNKEFQGGTAAAPGSKGDNRLYIHKAESILSQNKG